MQAADQSKLDLEDNGQYVATYGVDSTRGEIQLSGSGELTNGEAKIYFDKSFSAIISDHTPIRVLVTPTMYINGQLYVAEKTAYGFIVREIGGQDQTGKFDWLVIARRRGYEGQNDEITPTPEPPIPEPTPESTPETIPETTLDITPEPPPPEPTESPPPDLLPSPEPTIINEEQ